MVGLIFSVSKNQTKTNVSVNSSEFRIAESAGERKTTQIK